MTYLDALQDALAAEYAAVHVLGYLGAQTSESAQPDLYADLDRAYAAHRAARDLLTALVRDAGGTPAAAQPGYALPDVDGSTESVRAAAARVERTCATAYPALVSQTPAGGDRRFGTDRLVACALGEVTFGGRPRAFPGR